MMKNTEWGAVAYLQHSKYGSTSDIRLNNYSDYITGYQANAEPTCGYTGTNEECNISCEDNSCNTAYPNSMLSSTTNNITGIFDMSGGAWEYVMGILLDEEGNPLSGRNSSYNSGFNGKFTFPTWDNDTSGLTELTNGHSWPDAKYYDAYLYSHEANIYNRRILGDATGEMGPFESRTNLTVTRSINSWYLDQGVFINDELPFFWRGSGYLGGTNTGIFAFSNDNGGASTLLSFRMILTPV